MDMRRAVIDAALEVIATEGPDAVSMRDIARRAGVSHQAPYHHFGDRAGVFAAISEEGYRHFTEEFRTVLAHSNDPVRELLRAYVDFALKNKGHFKVMFRSDICGVSTHESTKAAADEAFLALLDFARLVEPGTPDRADPMTLPVLLWSEAHGLATLLIDGPLAAKLPPGLSIDDLVDSVARRAAELHLTPASRLI